MVCGMSPRSSKGKFAALLLVVVIVVAAVVVYALTVKPVSEPDTVVLVTSMGNITIHLFNDARPITTANFRNLIRQGKYDDTIFHRVIDGFMIQGGDPTGTGLGDSSIPTIEDELSAPNKNIRGAIAMANTGEANTASSQFFINLVDNNFRGEYFDASYSVFGKVVAGMDVVDAIGRVPTDANDRPLTPVRLIEAILVPVA
jgi:peptidylprolyl isomerase